MLENKRSKKRGDWEEGQNEHVHHIALQWSSALGRKYPRPPGLYL